MNEFAFLCDAYANMRTVTYGEMPLISTSLLQDSYSLSFLIFLCHVLLLVHLPKFANCMGNTVLAGTYFWIFILEIVAVCFKALTRICTEEFSGFNCIYIIVISWRSITSYLLVLRKYCLVSGVPWLIIMGPGLDDWIYWQLLLKSILITVNYNG
jgi:hypothetical protein